MHGGDGHLAWLAEASWEGAGKLAYSGSPALLLIRDAGAWYHVQMNITQTLLPSAMVSALVQLLLLRTHGGCGLLPSGTYHLCLPTTVPDRRQNATELFGRRLAELGLA